MKTNKLKEIEGELKKAVVTGLSPSCIGELHNDLQEYSKYCVLSVACFDKSCFIMGHITEPGRCGVQSRSVNHRGTVHCFVWIINARLHVLLVCIDLNCLLV